AVDAAAPPPENKLGMPRSTRPPVCPRAPDAAPPTAPLSMSPKSAPFRTPRSSAPPAAPTASAAGNPTPVAPSTTGAMFFAPCPMSSNPSRSLPRTMRPMPRKGREIVSPSFLKKLAMFVPLRHHDRDKRFARCIIVVVPVAVSLLMDGAPHAVDQRLGLAVLLAHFRSDLGVLAGALVLRALAFRHAEVVVDPLQLVRREFDPRVHHRDENVRDVLERGLLLLPFEVCLLVRLVDVEAAVL